MHKRNGQFLQHPRQRERHAAIDAQCGFGLVLGLIHLRPGNGVEDRLRFVTLNLPSHPFGVQQVAVVPP